MTASKSLPDRPSLESLRKQAKKLARDRSVALRDAQLILAREYGYAGWQDLTAEVSKRLGKGLEWAAAQARRVIHDNDVERLKQLLTQYPELLSWQGNEWDSKGGLLGIATGAYGDAGDPERERWFTRAACAELLLDAGAVVTPSVSEGLLESRAKGLLQLFQRKGLLPRTLKFSAALGDLDAVRTALDQDGNDLATVNEAFICAGRFEHEAVASLLLERSIALDPELGKHIDESVGRLAFVKYFIEKRPSQAIALGPWKAFVMEQVSRAIHDRDLPAFVSGLQREPWLLGEAFVQFQAGLIGIATLNDRGEFVTALLDLEPAILRRQPPPHSQNIEFAFTYGNTHLIPLLTRIWPVPDDLPHAAGIGNLARVKQWFDESGAPALGDVENHYPCSPYMPKDRVEEYARQWGAQSEQRVLDTAFAWSVINRHFDVADFLLEHGANINTNWNSHEPASILHHLVFEENYASMKFLIDRGIDMTIKDYRWGSNATGWARYGKSDEKMAQWLEEEERKRGR
jgi:hypothetical protein